MKKMIEPGLSINEGFSTIERVTIEGLQCTRKPSVPIIVQAVLRMLKRFGKSRRYVKNGLSSTTEYLLEPNGYRD